MNGYDSDYQSADRLRREKKPVHISDALKPVLESLGIRGDSVKKELLDENISGCCGAPLVTSAAGTQTKYVCSQCRRVERIG